MSLLCRLKNLVHKGVLKKEDLDRIVIIPKGQESCDCISRKSAILEIQRYGVGCFDADDFNPEQAERFVISRLNSLPSIQPKTEKEIVHSYLEKLNEHIINFHWGDTSGDFMTGVNAVYNLIDNLLNLLSEEMTDDKEYEKDLNELKAKKVIKMREATPEERESISKYIKNISKPTVVNFWDLEQEPKYCERNICIKNEYDGIGCDKCEVTKSQESCDDTISRADARHLIAEVNRKTLGCISTKAFKTLYNGIDELPPVTPKLQMIQNPCVECGCNYCTNDDCENRYILGIAESEE